MARPRDQNTHMSHREKLLDAGEHAFRETSFSESGINEILASSGVPKGPFYHHFASKEAFGIAVADRYSEAQLATLGPIRVQVGLHAKPSDGDPCDLEIALFSSRGLTAWDLGVVVPLHNAGLAAYIVGCETERLLGRSTGHRRDTSSRLGRG